MEDIVSKVSNRLIECSCLSLPLSADKNPGIDVDEERDSRHFSISLAGGPPVERPWNNYEVC